jgi:hypothetical protein
MGQYGQAAVRAVEAYVARESPSIVAAWEAATRKTCPTPSSQDKRCPRSTFLGICESGLVIGVPAGQYLQRASKNKQYGLNAVSVLRQQPNFTTSPHALWVQIGNAALKPNGQMDVIITMWKHGLIKKDGFGDLMR